MKCPNCGAPESELDWVVEGELYKGKIIWNCFECEHEWVEQK